MLCSLSQCARRCCAPHRCRGVTSPVLRKCWSVRCGADMVSARLRIVLDQPSPAARPGTRYAWQLWHTPATAKLHNAALLSVSASQSQAPFVAATASRPSGESNRRYAKLPTLERSHSRRRFPVNSCPTRRRLRALVAVVALWHQSGAARCLLGQWPTASHVVCAPAHPCASPLRGISPARWSARPPPVGAPSARAPLLLVFATGLVAGHARNTGATGLTACKPARPLAYSSCAIAPEYAMYLIAACARSMRARALFCI